MVEKRKEYIDRLLNDLKLLEERLLSVRESDALPFSFFSLSFDRVENISRSLHELELMQIGEMKDQMERLVKFLSETDARDSSPVTSKPQEPVVLPEYKDPRASLDISSNKKDPSPDISHPGIPVNSQPVPKGTEPRSRRAEAIQPEKEQSRFLNDVIQAPATVIDLKRYISVNDRFLFLRELFHNDRQEMERAMEHLSGLAGTSDAETYLKNELGWDMENQTAKDFLQVIKKGFE